MITALLIDDEPLARGLVREYLQSFPEIQIAQECGDGFEGVKAISVHKPDLIFLDVQMPKITGFEMLELLDSPPAVIFTTAFEEHALKAFEQHAIDYLLKPFSPERFAKAVNKAIAQIGAKTSTPLPSEAISSQPTEKERIVVRAGANIVIIPLHTVHYIEACDDYVKVHTGTGFYLKKRTLSHYEEILDTSAFLRVHRSYLLNLAELTRIEALEKDTHVALLKSGIRIPLSKAGYQKLKEVLGL